MNKASKTKDIKIDFTYKKPVTSDQKIQLFSNLHNRFNHNNNRHNNVKWDSVQHQLNRAEDKTLWALFMMELTGGEPDVVDLKLQAGYSHHQKFEIKAGHYLETNDTAGLSFIITGLHHIIVQEVLEFL